jgi:hypothetical protein
MKRFPVVFAILLIFIYIPYVSKAMDGKATITIDLSKTLGNLPYLYRAGVFNGNVIPDRYVAEKFLRDLKPGAISLYLAHPTIRPSRDMADLERRLSAWDMAAQKVVEQGGEIVVEIAAMPWWLTSNPSKKPVNPTMGDDTPVGNLAPPRDYNEWANMVERIVNHFNNKLKIKAKYTVWGEPDSVWWQGTEEEYFKLYRYAVLGAKRAAPDAKIGGPAVSGWESRKEGSDMPLIHNLIGYASQTALPEVGLKKLPIDYINWHQFNANPLDPKSFSEPVQTIKSWLKKYGYSEDTELLIGEWIIWQHMGRDHAFLNEEHDNEINASYIVSTLLAMDNAGIGRHSYAYLIDSVQGNEFIGDFGLFTKRGVIKANFNAFKAISMLGGKRLGVDNGDYTMRTLATQQGGKISILISNFVPWGSMLAESTLRQLKDFGYTREDARHYQIKREQVADIISGRASLESLNLPENVLNDVKPIISKLQIYQWRRNNPFHVNINIHHAENKRYRYEKFLIDSTHSNSYSLRNKIEPALLSTQVSEINEWLGVKLEMVEDGALKNFQSLPDIVLQPYAVMLLQLTSQ